MDLGCSVQLKPDAQAHQPLSQWTFHKQPEPRDGRIDPVICNPNACEDGVIGRNKDEENDKESSKSKPDGRGGTSRPNSRGNKDDKGSKCEQDSQNNIFNMCNDGGTGSIFGTFGKSTLVGLDGTDDPEEVITPTRTNATTATATEMPKVATGEPTVTRTPFSKTDMPRTTIWPPMTAETPRTNEMQKTTRTTGPIVVVTTETTELKGKTGVAGAARVKGTTGTAGATRMRMAVGAAETARPTETAGTTGALRTAERERKMSIVRPMATNGSTRKIERARAMVPLGKIDMDHRIMAQAGLTLGSMVNGAREPGAPIGGMRPNGLRRMEHMEMTSSSKSYQWGLVKTMNEPIFQTSGVSEVLYI